MKAFYDFLSDEIENHDGVVEEFICFAPDLFRLLCDMVGCDIDIQDRIKINAALAYFVLPNDFVPEHLYGPIGLIDDIFVCITVIQELQRKYGIGPLQKIWHNDNDLNETIDMCYQKSREFLNSKGLIADILDFTGLG